MEGEVTYTPAALVGGPCPTIIHCSQSSFIPPSKSLPGSPSLRLPCNHIPARFMAVEWSSVHRAQRRPWGECCLTSELSYSVLSQTIRLHQSVYKCFFSTLELHGTGQQRQEKLILSRGGYSRERSRDEWYQHSSVEQHAWWCRALVSLSHCFHILTLCRSHLLLKPSEACGQRVRVLCGKAMDLDLGGLGSHTTPPRSLSSPHCSVMWLSSGGHTTNTFTSFLRGLCESQMDGNVRKCFKSCLMLYKCKIRIERIVK